MKKDISIVVFANAKDFFLTKICVASIRHFYPEIELFLVKDELNGKFSSKSLEQRFNVKQINLAQRYFGWSAAKLHFLLECNEDRLFLCLDSDIVFIGPVLNKFKNTTSDYIVSPEYYELTQIVKDIFIDPELAVKYYPSYVYPGYFFNAGQTVVNPSKILSSDLSQVFDQYKYPYYKDYNSFKTVDQAILNALLPSLFAEKRIKLQAIEFFKGSVFLTEIENNTIEILEKKQEYLIHWAGDIRTIKLNKMVGYAVLNFFQSSYEERLGFFEKIYHNYQNILNSISILTKVKLKRNRLKIEINKFCKQ